MSARFPRIPAGRAGRLSSRALSLVELIVTVAILAMVVAGAARVFSEGLQLYRTNQAAADAQASALRVLSRIDVEIVNAAPELIACYSSPGNVDGVVFASPLNDDGTSQYHKDTGRIYWQKYVCYYLVPDLANPSNGKLYRKEERIADEPGAAAQGKSGHTDKAAVEAGLTSRTTDYFAAHTNLPVRMLGGSVSGFTAKEFDGKVEDGSGGTRSVLGGDTVSTRKFSVDLMLEAGDKNNRGPSGYYIRVDSRATPKG